MKLLTGNFLHSWYTGKLGQTRGGFREESPQCMITVGHCNFNSTLCNFWKGQDWAGKKKSASNTAWLLSTSGKENP